MTDKSDTTGPTLEEQIHWANVLIRCNSAVAPAVLESLLELQSIRSAELPVEPKSWIDETDPECTVTVVGVHSYNKLKAYALKEKERADFNGAEWQKSAEAIVEVAKKEANPMSENINGWKERAEKAESELAALRGRLMEPDEEMKDAIANTAFSIGTITLDDAMRLFKAMTAVALKEGK